MNVYLYSEDRMLLLELSEALRCIGETPFAVPDFATLQAFITITDPDIAFLDEKLFPQNKILNVQQHIFDVFLDFPVTSMTNPFFTAYRGKVSEHDFTKLAQLVSEISRKHCGKQDLSPKLSTLLSFLILHKNEKIETEAMMYHLWKDCNNAHKKTLHTYIYKLREQLAKNGNNFKIEKVAKSTYRLRTIGR